MRRLCRTLQWAPCGPPSTLRRTVRALSAIKSRQSIQSNADVLVSVSLLLTAGLEAGQRARIIPLSGAAVMKLPPGTPSLRDVQDSGTIRLRELVAENPAPLPGSASGSGSNNTQVQNKWLTLATREVLGAYTSSSLHVLISDGDT